MTPIQFFQYFISMRPTFCGLIAAVILLVPSIGAPQAMTPERQNTALSSLRSASSAELESIAKNYLNQHQADIQELTSIVGEQETTLVKSQKITSGGKEWFAITLLGDMRAATAVPLLARLLAVRSSSFSLISDEDHPHWYSFPAAVALSKIGLPAVQAVLDQARTVPPTSTTFHLGGVTLEAILGEELAIFAAEQYARDHSDFARADRLTALTALIRTGHKRWTAYSASDFSPE